MAGASSLHPLWLDFMVLGVWLAVFLALGVGWGISPLGRRSGSTDLQPRPIRWAWLQAHPRCSLIVKTLEMW